MKISGSSAPMSHAEHYISLSITETKENLDVMTGGSTPPPLSELPMEKRKPIFNAKESEYSLRKIIGRKSNTHPDLS